MREILAEEEEPVRGEKTYRIQVISLVFQKLL
jgi:hypothetical protein